MASPEKSMKDPAVLPKGKKYRSRRTKRSEVKRA
jgi:hypothetical protein